MKSFKVIWDHLESFESWGDKISYTIKMQDALSFFGQSVLQTSEIVGLPPPRFLTLRRPCAIGQASFWAERRFFCTLLWVNLLLVNWGLPEVCILTPFAGPSEPGAGGLGDCPPSRFWQIQYPIHNQRGRLRPLNYYLPPTDFQTFLRPCLGHSKRGSSISLKYDFLLTL